MKPYDPKLREAAEELKAVCRKYDCAGVVLLVSPTHAEFVNHLEASWSAIRADGNQVRIRCKREDFSSIEEQRKVVDATSHLLTSVHEWSRQTHANFKDLIAAAMSSWKFLWKAWGEPDSVPGDGK